MKVLLVTSVMPIRGGVAIWMNTVAEELRRNGHDAKIINAASGKGEKFHFYNTRITSIFSRLLNVDIIFFLAYLLIGILLKFKIAAELKNNSFDVVHAQDLNAFNAVYRLCKRKDCELVLTLHGHFYNGGTSSRVIKSHGWLSNYLFCEERHALQKAKQIITVSGHSYDFVKALNPEARIELIRNFVDTKRFYPLEIKERTRVRKKLNCSELDFVVLSVGRLARGKGIKYILEALTELCKTIPIKLIIVGNGPEYTELHSIAEKNSILQYVSFVGELTSRELFNYYNAADIFVIASITGEGSLEGTPMSLLEAMACALPTVATQVGGIGDVIKDGINGKLIPEKNVKALTEAFQSLYENSEIRQKLSKAALATIQQEYSVDKAITKLIDIYT